MTKTYLHAGVAHTDTSTEYMAALGMGWGDSFTAHDLVTGAEWQWWERNFVRLGADGEPAHIIHVRR